MPDHPLPAAGAVRSRNARRRARALAVLAVACGTLVAAMPTLAATCLYKKPDGEIYASNLPAEKGWKVISCVDGAGSPAAKTGNAAKSPTPPGFPRVDAGTQRSRDDMRRKVLTDELASEEKLLAEAKTAYADGAPAPLPEEKADAEKYRARIARMRQSVGLHEKNVEALKKEIAAVK